MQDAIRNVNNTVTLIDPVPYVRIGGQSTVEQSGEAYYPKTCK